VWICTNNKKEEKNRKMDGMSEVYETTVTKMCYSGKQQVSTSLESDTKSVGGFLSFFL